MSTSSPLSFSSFPSISHTITTGSPIPRYPRDASEAFYMLYFSEGDRGHLMWKLTRLLMLQYFPLLLTPLSRRLMQNLSNPTPRASMSIQPSSLSVYNVLLSSTSFSLSMSNSPCLAISTFSSTGRVCGVRAGSGPPPSSCPMQDFATSIVDIRNKLWEANELKRKAQRGFEQHLREAIEGDTLEDEYRDVRQAAIEGLSMLGEQAEWQEDIRQALSGIVEDEDTMFAWCHRCAIRAWSTSESREDIRSAIPCIVGCLRHMVSFIRQAAIDGLSRLGAQSEFQKDIGMAIPGIVECLGDSYRLSLAVVEVLSRLAKLGLNSESTSGLVLCCAEWIRNKLGHDQPDDDFDRTLQDRCFDTNPDSLDV